MNPNDAAPATETDLVITRVFAAPRKLVWKAWNESAHIAQWWGPRGFRTRVEALDFRVGGEWRFVMRGPDGKEYPCKGVFREIVPFERVVTTDEFLEDYDYQIPNLPKGIVAVASFEDVKGGALLTLRIQHPSVEERQKHEAMGVVAGWNSALDCLVDHLTMLSTGDASREICVTRLIKAPRDRVFAAWTDVEHISRWWGPQGFTTTTQQIDVRSGGEWRFVMHGPDGRDYVNQIMYVEIDRPAKLVYHQGGPQEAKPIEFYSTITFDDVDGHTQLTMRLVFLTPADRDHVEREYGAVEGGVQTLTRLEEFLGTPEAAEAAQEIVTTRVVPFPRDKVFRAWTVAEHLSRWWGPNGFTSTFHEFDPQPGGHWRFDLHGPNGGTYPNHNRFVEIVDRERIVIDHEGGHQFRITATFADVDGGTRVKFRMRFPSAEECRQFRDIVVPANEENFDRMEAELARMA